MTEVALIKKGMRNKILLLSITMIEKTFIRFQQWLWKFVETEPFNSEALLKEIYDAYYR